MLDCERMFGFTVRALDWFNDSTAFDKALLLVTTITANEGSLFHLRNYIAIPDNNATKCDHLINMLRAKLPNTVSPLKIMWSDLDENVICLLVVILMIATQIVHVEFFVHLGHHQVEDRDQVSWVVFHLTVQLGVISKDVAAVNVEHGQLQITDFL